MMKGVISISSPQDEVRSLIRQANDVHERAQSALKAVKGPIGPAIGSYAVTKYVPHGYKQIARSFGRDLQKDAKVDVDSQWRQQGVQLADTSQRTIGRMSIRTKNLTLSGNSRNLVVKFNKLTSKKTAPAYIRNLISILEGVEKLDLIWNTDIEGELRHRVEEKERLRREKEALKLEAGAIVEEARRSQFSKKETVLHRLKGYPLSRQSLVSAFSELQSPDPEAPRHCIFSSRVSIEQLCIDAGGSGNWKEGLNTLLSSNTDRRQVKAVWNNLSGKGAHGGHNPTPKEAEQCLALTLTTLEIILDSIQR
jgi:hypothetical protein